MRIEDKAYIALGDRRLFLLPAMANRHGLIAGATGTGKTVTMKVIAESFSDMGVPVFFSDVKGDLSGTALPGVDTEDMRKRIERFGIADDFKYTGYPVRFWDIFGDEGIPLRVTVSDMGPQLLSRLLNLTDVQAGVLNIVFKAADDQGLLLIDFKDLRAMVQFVGENRKEYTAEYGLVSTASIGAIQRALLEFEDEGAEQLFGEAAFNIMDWIRTDCNGRGYINILNSRRLIASPKVYATFLLWMLTALFDKLPEVGDLDKPRIVFFFDEAHLLFSDAPRALVQKIVQVVKLIRSKGVGVYFVTQSPGDIPDEVLAQLSNRIQHGLRAYTPSEQKNIRAAARSFRANPAFDSEKALMGLGTGEALVSFLDRKGIPEVVEMAAILPPQSLMGPASPGEVRRIIELDELFAKYSEVIDRESAFEIINAAREELRRLEAEETENRLREKEEQKLQKQQEQQRLKEEKQAEKQAERIAAKSAARNSSKDTVITKTARQAAGNAASSVARSVSTNLVNSLTGGKSASAGTIAKRAATSALSSVMRQGASAIIRGLFGNKK
ncbi:MAG: DUF853 family protein [Clostridia bacterium]|nr:DUF853 family protein [Clostridia bacterium]